MRALADELPPPSDWPTTESHVKAGQIAESSHFDVIVLGTSISEAAIDPDQLSGVEVYNSAMPFSTPISMEVWYRTVLSGVSHGAVVVVGMPIWPFHDTEHQDTLATAFEAAESVLARDNFGLELLRRQGLLAEWHRLRTQQRALDSRHWTDRGNQTVYRDGSSTFGVSIPPYGDPVMSADAEAAVRVLADEIATNNGKLVIMVEPARYPGEVPARDVTSYLESINMLASSLGVPVWDTYSLAWAPSYYTDAIHFNAGGTDAFTILFQNLLDSIAA